MGLKTTLTKGLEFESRPTSARNGQGADRVEGDLMMFDDELGSALATNLKEGDENSGMVVIVDADALRDENGWYCVLAEDIAAGEFGKVWLEHPGFRIRVSGPVSPGDRLASVVSGNGLGAGVLPQGRHLALCKGTGNTPDRVEALFLGVPDGDIGNE